MFEVSVKDTEYLQDLESDYRRHLGRNPEQAFFLTAEEAALLVKYAILSHLDINKMLPVGSCIFNDPKDGWHITPFNPGNLFCQSDMH